MNAEQFNKNFSPEEREQNKKTLLLQITQLPTKVATLFEAYKMLHKVGLQLYPADSEMQTRLKFKLEEMQGAYLHCAQQCQNLLQEIQNGNATSTSNPGTNPENQGPTQGT